MTGTKKPTVKDLFEEIKVMKQKMEEVYSLKERIVDLECQLKSLKSPKEVEIVSKAAKINCQKCKKYFTNKAEKKKHEKIMHNDPQIKCEKCGKGFSKNSDLEFHLETDHKTEKQFKCEKCDMSFVLKWRFQKHSGMHSENQTKFCHFFNNGKECPYSKLGCMFKHESAPLCKYQGNCFRTLCQFKHREEDIQNDCDNKELTEDKDFDSYVKTNFPKVFEYYLENDRFVPCYFCNYCSKSQNLKDIENEITAHIGTKHKEIMATFDPINSGYEDWIHEEFFQFFCPE